MAKSVQNLFSLGRKVALVTGASSGRGAHFARVVANAGASVIATDHRMLKSRDLARVQGKNCEL